MGIPWPYMFVCTGIYSNLIGIRSKDFCPDLFAKEYNEKDIEFIWTAYEKKGG